MTEGKYDPEKWNGLLAEIGQQIATSKQSQVEGYMAVFKVCIALYDSNVHGYSTLNRGRAVLDSAKKELDNARTTLDDMERLNAQLNPEDRLDTLNAKAVLEQKLEEFRQL